jgi:hypothetical protein
MDLRATGRSHSDHQRVAPLDGFLAALRLDAPREDMLIDGLDFCQL